MSDLEIDFEEAFAIAIKNKSYGYAWAEKIVEIGNTYKFGHIIEVVDMFNQWVDDRYKGLHA